MKIRILESVSSSQHGTWNVGDVVDWPDAAEAKQLIASGAAESASKKKSKTETASKAEKVETATAE